MEKKKALAVTLKQEHAPTKDEKAQARLERVLKATSTENPKKEDVAELCVLLKEYPKLWEVCGNLSRLVVSNALKDAFKQSVVVESVAHGLEILRRDLGIDRAPALERILIENVCVLVSIASHAEQVRIESARWRERERGLLLGEEIERGKHALFASV